MKFSVCVGSACHVKGSYNVLLTLRQLVEEYSLHDQVEVTQMFCDGECASTTRRPSASPAPAPGTFSLKNAAI